MDNLYQYWFYINYKTIYSIHENPYHTCFRNPNFIIIKNIFYIEFYYNITITHNFCFFYAFFISTQIIWIRIEDFLDKWKECHHYLPINVFFVLSSYRTKLFELELKTVLTNAISKFEFNTFHFVIILNYIGYNYLTDYRIILIRLCTY